MYRRRPARRRKPTDDGQAEPSYSCGEQLAARERRWPWRESSLCRARLVSPVVVSINKGSLLLCEKGVCAPWHKTCRSTKEVPNFRERRQCEVRRSSLSSTTAYCVDIDLNAPCMYEWLSKPLGRTVCVCIMRCGSTTPKSAVGHHQPSPLAPASPLL